MSNHSPEDTGIYQCPACPNKRDFIGINVKGFGGPSMCECGACDYENPQRAEDGLCVCDTELRQPFHVSSAGVEHEAFTGGGTDAEIGQYTHIDCVACGATVWTESEAA